MNSTMNTNWAAVASARYLPPLPPVPCPPEYRGPTPWSNWVIKGRVLAGAYPASVEDEETESILTKLLELGVDTFVCLQAEFWLNAPEDMWRSGQALRPYVKDAHQLLIRAKETGNPKITQSRLDLLHLPIIDGGVTSDNALSRLADDCCQRILHGEKLYIHCWGGHGRTGTLVSVILARLYGLSTIEALTYTQALHDVRRCPQGVRSPQTQVQVEQVKRILSAEKTGDRARSYSWPTQPLLQQTTTADLASLKTSFLKSHPVVGVTKQAMVDAMEPPIRTESLIPAVLAPNIRLQSSSSSSLTDNLNNNSAATPPSKQQHGLSIESWDPASWNNNNNLIVDSAQSIV